MVISFFGFKSIKRNYEEQVDSKTFLFLIPACNEENVIESTLINLKKLDYNEKLYDVTTLVNNSVDNTLEISKKSDFKTIEILFDENESKNKSYVLRKFFEKEDYWKQYDYIIILDADNIVSERYLKEINSQLIFLEEEGKEITVVQGYLGVKNVFTSFMSAGYASSYFVANRMFQLAKYRLGMNTAIGGTGFAIKTNYIIDYGWNPKSYTEDFELQVELALSGKKSIWNHFAIIYDEKPNTFLQSHRQRLRWAQGHWYITFITTFKQIIGLFNLKSLNMLPTKVETLAYSYSLSRPIIWLLIIIASFFIDIPEEYRLKIFEFSIFWFFIFLYNNVFVVVFGIISETKHLFSNEERSLWYKIKKIVILILSGYYCGITYFIQQTEGFFTCFKKQNKWIKTEHQFTDDIVEKINN